jgi:hypothetical protein
LAVGFSIYCSGKYMIRPDHSDVSVHSSGEASHR